MFLKVPPAISGFISRENKNLDGAILTFQNDDEIYIFHIEGLIRHNLKTNVTKAYKFVGDKDATNLYANNYSAFTWDSYGLLHIVDFQREIVYYPCPRLNDLWLPYSNGEIFGAFCISTKIARRFPFAFSIYSAIPIQPGPSKPGLTLITADRFDLELLPLYRRTYRKVRLNLIGSEIPKFDINLSFPNIAKPDDKNKFFEISFDPISGKIEGPIAQIRQRKKKCIFDMEVCL